MSRLGQTLLNRLRAGRRAVRDRIGGVKVIHFLHIGKNAGSEFNDIARLVYAARAEVRFICHPHRVRLGDLPPDAPYLFSIRDPISRFQSGFYSRKRKGQPRNYVEWSDAEAQIFGTFQEANDLAEALFQPCRRGELAYHGMQTLRHVRSHQHHWFDNQFDFLERRPPLAILRQEHFDADLERLFRALGIKQVLHARNTERAHQSDYSGVPRLGERARQNLMTWYAADAELVRRCRAWVEDRL